MMRTSIFALLSLLGSVAFSVQARAATSGANGTHDPSRMISSDGKFYVYSTGGGSKSSTDGLAWTSGPGLFGGGNSLPSALTTAVANNEGIWAPDAIYYNNKYYIYYSIANTKNECAVGLITTPTLDSTSPNYKLTNVGLVISNPGTVDYCMIDPCPVVDGAGDLWLSWGSGYSKSSSANTIYITRLDNTTGLLSSADSAKPGHPLKPGHIEASYIYYHSGSYFLFWNSGGCCNGAQSTYLIHMARATTITGPYTGDRTFYQTNGSIHGPGQIGIYDQCGADRFTYHYYPDSGGSVLGENELSWGADGWPVVGAPSTSPLKACAQGGGGSGTAGGGNTGGGQGGGGGIDAAGGSAGSAAGASGGTASGGQAGDINVGVAGSSSSAGGPPSLGGSVGVGGGSPLGSSGSPAMGNSGSAPTSGGDTSDTSSGCSLSVPQNRGGVGGTLLIAAAGIAFAGSRRKKQK